MMAVQSHGLAHAENWDEDFDFQRAKAKHVVASHPLKASTSAAENWDDDFEDQKRLSPRSQKKQSPFKPGPSKSANTENWDEDFEDNAQSSPKPPRISTSQSVVENWDDEFADGNPPVENWDDEFDGTHSSDDDFGGDKEEDRTVTAQSRRVAAPNATPPPPVPHIPIDLREHAQFPRSPTTSIFSIPTTIGTNRPESSAGYSFNSTMGLKSAFSGGPITSSARRFAGLPASPPVHRERRRLRKKSRPSNMDDTLIELDDRSPISQPTTPSRPGTPEVTITPDPTDFGTPPNANTSTGSVKSPLLSRIGSVKKWRPGRKRLSTEPQEVVAQQDDSRRRNRRSIDHDTEVTPRPPSVLAKVQRSPSGGPPPSSSSNGSRFFRVPGSAGGSQLKNERSMEGIGLGPSPAKDRMKKQARDPSPSPLYGSSRRPSSMLANGNGGSVKLRHTSSGGIFSSMNRSASASRSSFSASVEDLTQRVVRSVSKDKQPARVKEMDEEEEARRSFMGIRRISFGASAPRIGVPGSGGVDGDGVKKKLKEKDPGKLHKKSKSSITLDTTRLPDIVSKSIVSDEPPQIPTLANFPLTPIFYAPPETSGPGPSSSTLLPPVELSASTRTIQPLKLETVSSSGTLLKPSPTEGGKASALLMNKVTTSPQQSASLGRTTQPPKDLEPLILPGGKVARRNSLSDLKIPTRISQAQTGLKRDLGMVKEFARSVEQLKELQITYNSLILEVQFILNSTRTRPSTPAAPSRPTSPTTLFHARRRSRSNATAMPRSTTSVQLSNQLQEIENKYSITWECAELLIELGGGPAIASISKVPSQASLASHRFPSSNSAPPDTHRRNRERAITIAGDEQSPILETMPLPPVPTSTSNNDWRGSAGRHDLSHRQLVLLRDMLNYSDLNPESPTGISVPITDTLQIPEGESVNRQWRWGSEVVGSTITLPSEGSSAPDKSPAKKRKGRLGMSAVRDMLKSLKRTVSEQSSQNGAPPSSESSVGISESGHGRRRAKTSTGPDSVRERDRESPFPSFNNNHRSPYGSTTLLKSPRRPSLASIFRFSKNTKSSAASAASEQRSVENFKNTPPASSSGGTGSGNATTDEDDWDRVDDSASDLDFHSPRLLPPPDGSATLRGNRIASDSNDKSPYMMSQDGLPPATPRRGPDASRSSIWEGTWSRGTKLSNVEELVENLTPSKPVKSKQKASEVFRISPTPSVKKRDYERPPSRTKRLSGMPLPPPPALQRGGKSASMRSTPPQWVEYTTVHKGPLPDPKLAMTPENIKPLLENAREVHIRCLECVEEMRLLLSLGEAGRT